jgi:hypothetical protein
MWCGNPDKWAGSGLMDAYIADPSHYVYWPECLRQFIRLWHFRVINQNRDNPHAQQERHFDFEAHMIIWVV